MCLAGRAVAADMSRISNRASTVAAVLGIVLLVILLVILWTGVHTLDSTQKPEETSRDPALQTLNVFFTNETTTENRVIEDNFTNEVIPKTENVPTVLDKSENDVSSTKKVDVEYVKMMKLSQNQYEDPPDPFSTAKRHDSGHFRHSTAEVWDPHPQYEFTAFGKLFHLRLAHDSSFVSSNIKITHISENTTRREHPGHELGCFYSGTVDGDPYSAVTVSLCHGMRGHVRTSTGSYIINPAEPWQGDDKDSLEFSLLHTIQRLRTPSTDSNHVNDVDNQAASRSCGVIDHVDDAPTPVSDDTSADGVYVRRSRKRRSLIKKTSLDHFQGNAGYGEFVGQSDHHRNFLQDDNRYERYYSVEHRRNDPSETYSPDSEMESDPFVTWRPRRDLPRQYFIEIMVVADAKMSKYHGEGLVRYILDLMSTVSRIYKDPSIGNPISISVKNIVKTDQVFASGRTRNGGIVAADMLKIFCNWQAKNNPDESSTEHHDVALLLTREILCHNPEEMHCVTLGLAELGRMCSPGSSCAIIHDNGLAAAFTIAHEIGHVFNMSHDDDPKCVELRNRSDRHNIMFRTLDDSTDPWEWSKCSRHSVTEFLESGHGNCLLNEPAKTIKREDERRLPGEDYSADKQCQLTFGGPGSRVCDHKAVCKKLWCTVPKWGLHDDCHNENTPWEDGTPCGENKWCLRGECVSRRNLVPINGQWGEWKEDGKCSRTCGGGVRMKSRECNNPPPQNHGNYCVGDRVMYLSCGTEECPPGSPDFREQQCSHFNNDNMNIRNLTADVKWHAKYMPLLEDQCALYCEVESKQYYRLRREKVIDGTPCALDTFHICVNGQCKPAGCDHVLNSSAELDTCGVCKGDNSTCQRITGSYNSTRNGYTKVVKIPAGSSYIDIRQHGWKGLQNDSNYLALRLGKTGDYLVNGNFVVMKPKVIVLPGVTIEYSGPNSVVERLNSSRPTSTDLILEVLSVYNTYPPQITYEYTVSKKIFNSYKWVLSNWSHCSHTCQGTKYRRAECRHIEHKDVMPNDFCRGKEKPQEESQICNNHCFLQWQITSMSECSSHCGPGTRSVTSRCMQILLIPDYPPQPIPSRACAHLQQPSDEQPCTGPCENVHWSYGEYGSCSVTCGGGVQLRAAVCVDSNGRPVSEDACAGQEKHLTRICGQDVCPKWDLGKWNPCSVSCGIGKRRRHYLCHVENRVVPYSYCGDPPPGVVEICNAGPCALWQAGDWSPCSVTCGEGTKERQVICKSTDGTISNKCSPSDKPDDIATCALKPCPTMISQMPIKYSPDPPQDDPSPQDNEVGDITFRSGYKWQVGSHKQCSKPCIRGFMRTVVTCVAIETGTIAPDDYCDRKKKPSDMIACNRHMCPMWNTGDWSQCDVKCGVGSQHRQVRCQSPHGDIIQDDHCHDSEKPEVVKLCRKNPCASGSANRKNQLQTNIFRKWKVSNWTRCSKSCGSGVQRRMVECTMRRGNHGPEVIVKDEQCSRLGLNKPRSQRACRRIACGYIWQEGPWSECSAECGEGIQRRAVTCHRTNRYGFIDSTPSDNCPMDQKPTTEQICKLRECDDKYYWSAGPWTKCSHTCGQKGRQIRRLFCHDRTGKKVARVNCPIEFKPHRKQKCNQRKCFPTSCLEAKKYFRTIKDNEYTLVVGGRSMSIYCHGMATSDPKEYLTLPAGYRENYAEVYDKRLKQPQSCPYNGRRNDSCNCATDVGTISGKTMFRRIRIDPVKLRILDNDYTFTWTEGSKRVKYGTAGDCYSLADCAQGRFSINLHGTQFKLSPEVDWKGTHGASVKINHISKQHVTGKCGGYCGFCNPTTELKLDVLPP